MSIATRKISIWWKEGLKILAGQNFLSMNPRDVFFQMNSLIGDKLSNSNDKDEHSDIDAYILDYHPKFRNKPLNESIRIYYSLENLQRDKKSPPKPKGPLNMGLKPLPKKVTNKVLSKKLPQKPTAIKKTKKVVQLKKGIGKVKKTVFRKR